jgi:hypothetical protein
MRILIDNIVLVPEGEELRIEIHGALAGILELCQQGKTPGRGRASAEQMKVVAGPDLDFVHFRGGGSGEPGTPFDNPIGELVRGIFVGGMFSKEPAKKVSAARQGEADREHEMGAERVLTHGRLLLFRSSEGRPGPQVAVKAGPGHPFGRISAPRYSPPSLEFQALALGDQASRARAAAGLRS